MEWCEAYEQLREYVAGCAEITCTPRSLSVPKPLRDELYGRVETVQRGVGREVLGARMTGLAAVAADCSRVRGLVCAKGNLKALKLADTLERLLADPEAESVRPAFALVLQGLQEGLDACELRARVAAELVPHADLLYRNAYEAWAYYSVVAALEPRRFWAVSVPDTQQARAVPTEVVEVATQAVSPTRRFPEAVFECADGRCFAMKTEAARELDYYGFKLKRRRDSSAGGMTANLLCHRVLLLWELAGPDAVVCVADRDAMRLTPTDLMVEVLEPADMGTPAYVSAFVERVNAVRSKRPVQVLCAASEGAFPEGMLDDPTVAPIELRRVQGDPEVFSQIAGLL